MVILTVAFSALMNATAEPIMAAIISFINVIIFGAGEEGIAVEDALIEALEDMTGFAPQLDWTLDQCGLSSVGLPQLASRLKNAFSSKTNPVSISAAQLSAARTVGDIVDVIKAGIEQANADGI